MKALVLTMCVLATAGCGKKKSKKALVSHRVTTLDFASFTIAVPPGWSEIDNPEIKQQLGPNGRALLNDAEPSEFNSSIVITDLTRAPGAMMGVASEAACEVAQQQAAAQVGAQAGKLALTTFGKFRGCDFEI